MQDITKVRGFQGYVAPPLGFGSREIKIVHFPVRDCAVAVRVRPRSFVRIEAYEPDEYVHHELRNGKFVEVRELPF